MSDHNQEAERAAPDMLAAFHEWMRKRGPLGAGAIPERIFFAGWLAAHRAPAVGEDGLPREPWGDDFEAWLEVRTGHEVRMEVRQYAREAVAADRLARRPRVTLDPELKAALDGAAKTRSTVALLPDGEPVFINYGHQHEDTAHLECTACGGSGHIDDQRLIATQDELDAKRYRMLRDSEKIPAAVWHALETGIWVDETIDGWIAETSPIPFCEPCKAGRYGECQYAIPCTLPAPIAAPSLSSEQHAEKGERHVG